MRTPGAALAQPRDTAVTKDNRLKLLRELAQRLELAPDFVRAVELKPPPGLALPRVYVRGEELPPAHKMVVDYVIKNRADPKLRENVRVAVAWLDAEFGSRGWDPDPFSREPAAPIPPPRRLTPKQAKILELVCELIPNEKMRGKTKTAEITRQVGDVWKERGLGGTPPDFKTVSRALGRSL